MKEKDRYAEYEARKKREARFSRINRLSNLEDMQGLQPHSTAYHEYFEGYAETKIPNENGIGYRVERVYAAPWMRAKLTKRQRIARRVLYPVLWLPAAAGLLISAVQRSEANKSLLTVVPTCAALVMTVLAAIALYRYETAPELQRIGQYRAGSEGLLRWSGYSALALLADAAGAFLWLLLNRSSAWSPLLLLPAISAAAMGDLWLTEKNTEYEKVPNPVQLPGNAFLIE